MDHVGLATAAFGVLVGQVEPMGQVEVELHRGALPGAAQGVGDVDVNLGSVERSTAFIHGERQTPILQRALQRFGGVLPHLWVANVLLGPGGQRDGIIFEPECVQQFEGQFQDPAHLIFHLVRCAEDMGVVLGETAHAHQPVQNPAPFVAIDRAKFRQANGQLAAYRNFRW